MPSTREFALLFIYVVIFVFTLKHTSKLIPSLLLQLLQLLRHVYLQIVFLYVTVITFILIATGFLEWKLTTSYLIMTASTLALIIPSGYSPQKINWLHQLKKITALTALLTVIINNYTMHFLIELPLMFLVSFSTLIVLYLRKEDPQSPVIKLSNSLIAIIGFVYLSYTIYAIFNNLNDLSESYFWKNLSLGGITFFYIPLVFFLKKHNEKLQYLQFPRRKKSV